MTHCSVLCDCTLSGSWNVSTRHHSVCAVRDSLQWFVAAVHCRVARFRRKSHCVSWLTLCFVADTVFRGLLLWFVTLVRDRLVFSARLHIVYVVRDSSRWFMTVVRGRVARFRKILQCVWFSTMWFVTRCCDS